MTVVGVGRPNILRSTSNLRVSGSNDRGDHALSRQQPTTPIPAFISLAPSSGQWAKSKGSLQNGPSVL